MITYEVHFGNNFKKLIKKFPSKKEKINICINKFITNPFEPSLKTHKLSGKLEGIWSFSIDTHLRITFKFQSTKEILLLDIGTHEIYK